MAGTEDRIQTVGERIRALQRVTRATNEELALAANVHVKTVSQWRHDRQTPTDDNLTAIAPTLKTTFELLKYGWQEAVPGESPGARSRRQLQNLAVRESYRIYPQPPVSRLPPRAYGVAYDYLKQLEAAGYDEAEIEWASEFLANMAFNKLNSREPRERSEDEIITDLRAGWVALRDIAARQGRKL